MVNITNTYYFINKMAFASASLDFVRKNADKETNYREDQKELIEKALDITNGDPLGSLQYIVSCFAHEGINVEFEFEYCVDNIITMFLPIVEIEPKDPLGFYVIWGDGTMTHNETRHIYKSEKEPVNYKIRFFGLGIKQFGRDMPYNGITKIISFGNLGHTFTSLAYACSRCLNLESVPPNIPRTITDLSFMFQHCYNFNFSIETWDVSNVTNMKCMFMNCQKFNQGLNSWNTSNVTDISYMFVSCHSFNQTLNSWDTKNVTDMAYMFEGCYEFNHPIDKWDFSNVTNTNFMFKKCHAYEKTAGPWDIVTLTKIRS